MTTAPRKAIVIGAGMGGLSAAIDLARLGLEVTVLEKEPREGGKARRVPVNGTLIDAGPTVFTMRWIFDGLFNDAGSRLEDFLSFQKADVLARHAWTSGGVLDLFADRKATEEAIGVFAGPREAAGYRSFCDQSARIFSTLRDTFIADQRPTLFDVMKRVGFFRIGALLGTKPLTTFWHELGSHFNDPRLRQLFGRYATYVGSSPWKTTATLMLVAHVEQDGVWYVDGGMAAVASAMRKLAQNLGVKFQFDTRIEKIGLNGGSVSHLDVSIADQTDRIDTELVVFNGDVAALADGLLEGQANSATKPVAQKHRSLSAFTACFTGTPQGLPLSFHNVFFADDYHAEFDALFSDQKITERPTVYLCAQDRQGGELQAGESERFLALINAPANGDTKDYGPSYTEVLVNRIHAMFDQCGLSLNIDPAHSTITDPSGFHQLFPATGGALYGRASHGMMASFAREGARTKIKGLYLAGGSVHPGPGVPMAVMSGRLAATQIQADAAPSR